jgi:phenylacetate-CoA ligase
MVELSPVRRICMLLQVFKSWIWLQRTQWMRKEQLNSIQCEKLRKTVLDASREVPFYNKLYRQAGVDVDGVVNVGDIRKLPPITQLEFRKTPIQDRTARDADVNSCALGSSSGTTGMPVTVLEDPYSAAYREALMLRFLRAYGVRPWDRIARGRYVSAPIHQGRLAEKHGLWRLIRRKYVKQRFFTDFDDQLQFLTECKADILIAFSSYCRALARHCENRGKELNFRLVVTGGDLLDDSTRKLISDRFQAEVFDHYGIEEVGGSIAWECPTHSGYHINSESLLLEFLRNGEPVSAGETGELYVTCFYRKATPVVRYFTGDLAQRVDDDCSCGRGLPLVRNIEGRVLDYIITTEGRHVSPHQVLNTLTDTYGVEQFKVTQREDLSIKVRIKTDVTQADRTVQDVQKRCTELFGKTPLDVIVVEKMEAEPGKYRIVESRATN